MILLAVSVLAEAHRRDTAAAAAAAADADEGSAPSEHLIINYSQGTVRIEGSWHHMWQASRESKHGPASCHVANGAWAEIPRMLTLLADLAQIP